MEIVTATIFSVETSEERAEALLAAATAVQGGRVIVVPTDTVYGIAADAFSAGGVRALLAAKGRSRQMPPPVLIYDPSVLPGLADRISSDAQALADAFWPGALTLICHAQPSLTWDLGETKGTVALRVPDDELTIELLRQTGPLAVSSANKTGRTAATTAEEANSQLGENVNLIIDGGMRPRNRAEGTAAQDVAPSTIIDCTGDVPVVVREGAISLAEIRSVAPSVMTRDEWEEQKRQAAQSSLQNAGGSVAASSVEQSQAGETESKDSGSPHDDAVEPIKPARQAAPVSAGSPLNGLVTASGAQTQAIDQLRTEGAHFVDTKRVSDQTKPLSVSDARALVFGED